MSIVRRRSLLLLGLLAVVSLALLVWAALVLARAFPPRVVRMAAGPEGDADHELAERYRAFLAKKGVELVVETTAGKVANLARLEDPKSGVSAAFSVGGLTTAGRSPGVASLGTIAYDPLWVFCRGLPDSPQLGDVKGKRISIGPEGSATRALVLQLLKLNRLEGDADVRPLSPGQGAEALERGEIDCACMVTYVESPTVRKLLADPRIDLVSLPRVDAYLALFPYLRKLTLPMGVGDLALNRPPRDVTLMAVPEGLLVRQDLHPAIQYLLLEAAEEIHAPPGIFQRPGEFPAAQPVDVPLSDEARQFYKSGATFFQRHLPFWLWVFASRLIVVLVPLLGVVYPLVQLVPAAIAWEVDRRLTGLYAELRAIEARVAAGAGGGDVAAELDRLEEKIHTTRVPASYTRALYTLKQHAGLVRERLSRSGPRPSS